MKNNNNDTKVTLSSVTVETLSVRIESSHQSETPTVARVSADSIRAVLQGNLHVEANIPHGHRPNTDVLDTLATDAGATEPSTQRKLCIWSGRSSAR